MTITRGSSIRAQIVAIVMAGGILPLVLVGAWLASSSVRSGKELLRQHLVAAADRFVTASEARWRFRYSDLLAVGAQRSCDARGDRCNAQRWRHCVPGAHRERPGGLGCERGTR